MQHHCTISIILKCGFNGDENPVLPCVSKTQIYSFLYYQQVIYWDFNTVFNIRPTDNLHVNYSVKSWSTVTDSYSKCIT